MYSLKLFINAYLTVTSLVTDHVHSFAFASNTADNVYPTCRSSHTVINSISKFANKNYSTETWLLASIYKFHTCIHRHMYSYFSPFLL